MKDFLFSSRFVELFSCSAAQQLFLPRTHHRSSQSPSSSSRVFDPSSFIVRRYTEDWRLSAAPVMRILLGSPVPSIIRLSRRPSSTALRFQFRKWNTFAECYPLSSSPTPGWTPHPPLHQHYHRPLRFNFIA